MTSVVRNEREPKGVRYPYCITFWWRLHFIEVEQPQREELSVLIDRSYEDHLIKTVNGLSPDLRKKVLDYAESLSRKGPKGVPGKNLLHFAGCIDREDLRRMTEAIEEDCERIDSSGW